MITHQVAAIVIGALILTVTFFPAVAVYIRYDLEMLLNFNTFFIYPTVGIVAAGIIVYLSFLYERDKK